jgi:ABC-type spermidine/putrescine transport system permease subunit II
MRRSAARRPLGLYTYLVVVLAFMLLPIAIVVVSSFSSVSYGSWPPPAYSLRWYRNLSQQVDFASGAVRSVEVGLVATLASLLVGTLASLALTRLRFPGRGEIHAFLLSPMIVPKIALGLAGFVLFLRLDLYGSLASLMLAHTVLLLPFMVTVVGAGMIRLSRALEEAAMDLGCPPARAFWEAVVPQIRRSLLAASVLSFVISFDEVDASIFLVSPDNKTLPIAMYVYMQKYQDPTLAALSSLLVGGTFLVAVALLVVLGPAGITQFVPGSPDRARGSSQAAVQGGRIR